jgi:DNA polymerase-3 subunit delta
MAGSPPTVYLLFGEDEFGIAGFLAELSARLGDPTTAALNTTRLEGSAFSIEGLRSAAFAMPFLASRRMVVVLEAQSRLPNKELREKFTGLLDQLPPTAAVVLVEHRSLADDDWLLAWARQAGPRAFVRSYSLLNEGDMVRWLQDQARHSGGEISAAAAGLLARMLGTDARMAFQELQKLLAYVNYSRAVQTEDVEALGIPVFHETIFALVDALAHQDGKSASRLLRNFLDEQDPGYVFTMITRQFRLLLLAREVLDAGGTEQDVRAGAGIKTFYEARKITAQARRFSISTLESVYRKLLEIDSAIKTGQIADEVALDSLVAGVTTP